MMNLLQKMILALGAIGFIATAPVANATPFTVTGASFAPGTGYGIDDDESAGTQLNVLFSTSGFSTQDFALNSVGQFFTFNFGTVDLEEPNSHGGITAAEQDNLGVTANFTFTNPTGDTQSVVATGSATAGSVSDSFADYTLVWNPVTVLFGSGGEFEIAMSSLSFTGTGPKDETATITLTHLSEDRLPLAPVGNPVPEPATLALFGIGLLAFAVSRRNSAGTTTV